MNRVDISVSFSSFVFFTVKQKQHAAGIRSCLNIFMLANWLIIIIHYRNIIIVNSAPTATAHRDASSSRDTAPIKEHVSRLLLGAKANMAVRFERAGFVGKLMQADIGATMCFSGSRTTSNVSELLHCLNPDWKSAWRSLRNTELIQGKMGNGHAVLGYFRRLIIGEELKNGKVLFL